MNQATAVKSDTRSVPTNAFTFWVGDSLFAIDLLHILSIEQDNCTIHPDPFEGLGALGVVKHRGVPVRVFDFATFVGIMSSGEQKEELVQTLTAREQDHVDWLNALERAIQTNEAFAKARDPHQCAFGQWYDSYHNHDEEFMDILKRFDEPHKRIHGLADHLLDLNGRGQTEAALKQLNAERQTTLAQLQRLFNRARNQIRDRIKSVLLFITTNGKDPCIALLLNEIDDMIEFDPSQISETTRIGVTDEERLAKVFVGYINRGDDRDSLLIDVHGLLEAALGHL